MNCFRRHSDNVNVAASVLVRWLISRSSRLAYDTMKCPRLVTIGIMVLSLVVLLSRKVERVWVILVSGVLEVTSFSFHLASGLH